MLFTFEYKGSGEVTVDTQTLNYNKIWDSLKLTNAERSIVDKLVDAEVLVRKNGKNQPVYGLNPKELYRLEHTL